MFEPITKIWCGSGIDLPPHVMELASRFNWEFTPEPSEGLNLRWQGISLQLLDPARRQKPLVVDFVAELKRLRFGQKDLLAKAIGFRRGHRRVVDATAGLGQDTLRLLKLGCEVRAIERDPVVYALLVDALMRAEKENGWRKEFSPRLHLHFGESRDVLAQCTPSEKEVVYLDPMFPSRQKSALNKGEMQILQSLLGEEQDLQKLFVTGLSEAGRRLVLKRPRLAPRLEPLPSVSFVGRAVRYDVWIKN